MNRGEFSAPCSPHTVAASKMKLSGSEVLFPEYATPSEASANSPRGSVLICANPVFVLIPHEDLDLYPLPSSLHLWMRLAPNFGKTVGALK